MGHQVDAATDQNGKKYEFKKIPPEGGWGALVCVGMALPFICALSSMPSFGLMFNDYLDTLGGGTSATALITSSFFSAFSFAGLFTNILFKKFSIRAVGVAGSTLYFLGSVMTIFVTSVEQLLFSFSILQGAGFGLMIPVAYTTFNSYFVEKRVFMMSIAQSLIGVGTMAYPLIVQFFMDLYGFRGCMAMIAAVNSHAIFGMLVMHPVNWHMKSVKVFITDVVNCDEENEAVVPIQLPDVQIVVMNEDENNVKNSKDEAECRLEEGEVEEKEEPFIPPKRGSLRHVKAMEHLDVINERRSSLSAKQIDGIYDINKRRASSISSLGNWTGAVIVSEAIQPVKKNGKWQFLVDFLDLTLLNDRIYVNIVLGISFALYSDVAFFTIQPLYLFQLGYSKSDTAFIIAVGAAADLLSRIFLAVLSVCLVVKARYVYLAGAVFTIIFRFVFLHIVDFSGMLVITAILGFLRTWIHVPLPLVFSEYLSFGRFPSGYGLFMFLQGNITFAIGPFVGWIRDATGSYELVFHCLTVFMSLCAVPWLIEIFYLRVCVSRRKGEGNNFL